MTQVDPSKPVVVTGGAGYIASWVVKYLLEDGFTVRATVRSLGDERKLAHLKALAQANPGRLELFEADLLKPGSFDQAISGAGGCSLVFHMASPFVLKVQDVDRDLIQPAVNGTRNVLEAATRAPTVKRVVLTSSVAAIMGDGADAEGRPGRTLTEDDWNTTSNTEHQPYAYSKTLAEREAWRIAQGQKQWDLLVINPAFVLGPSLSNRADGESAKFMQSMLGGAYRMGVPRLTFGVVDVRDVARAHLAAGLRSQATGRHILCARTMDLMEIADALRAVAPQKYPLPTMITPKALAFVMGPFFGLSWSFVKRNVNHPFELRNDRSVRELGIQYRRVEETLLDQAKQMEASDLI